LLQKSLALAPGLAIIILSERIYNERIKNSPSKTLYFDFNSYINNGSRGQTPFTPAVRVMLELHDMLCRIKEKGLNEKLLEVKTIASDFRKRLVQETTLKLPDYPMSNA